MQMKNFNLGLFGKKYFDTIYYFNKFKLSETNIPYKIEQNIGGIYNFKKILNNKINYFCFKNGETHAKIISDLKTSSRTSILTNSTNAELIDINYDEIDWIHISYIDDLENIESVLDKKPISIDFCKEENRKKYLNIINKSKIVFDSRERRHLYNDLKTKTPIILHDPFGCECLVNNKIIYSQKCKPIKGMHVNGAGDIFCGIFLYTLYNKSLKEAIKTSCQKTTKNLIKINEI